MDSLNTRSCVLQNLYENSEEASPTEDFEFGSVTWEMSPERYVPVHWGVEAVIISRRQINDAVEQGGPGTVIFDDFRVLVVEHDAVDRAAQRVAFGGEGSVLGRRPQEVMHGVLDALHLLQVARFHATEVQDPAVCGARLWGRNRKGVRGRFSDPPGTAPEVWRPGWSSR